jgi:hypothetical protein
VKTQNVIHGPITKEQHNKTVKFYTDRGWEDRLPHASHYWHPWYPEHHYYELRK